MIRGIIALLLIVSILPSSARALYEPVIVNSDFEDVHPGNDAPGWGWYTRAQAWFKSTTENPHSGVRCLVFHNESGFAPEVYGRLYQTVAVYSSTEYELSLWVRGSDVASGNHLTDWNSYTLNLPSGTFEWTRVSVRFKTRPGQTVLNLGINVVNRCEQLAIDDISLRPVGIPISGMGFHGTFFVPGRIDGDLQSGYLAIEITAPGSGVVDARITAGEEELLRESVRVGAGANRFEWQWNSGRSPSRVIRCELVIKRDTGGSFKVVRSIEKVSPAVVLADIDRIEARVRELDDLLRACKGAGIPVDYEEAVRVMLEQFIPLARLDASGNELRRADFSVVDFDRALDDAIGRLRTYLSNPALAPRPVRYASGPVEIKGLSFIGNRRDWKGRITRGPIFFCGYGHFTQVRKDIPLFRRYGVNIIQIEIGPSAVFPSENEVSLEAVDEVVRVLDRAALYGVMVNILLSPHYFPAWAIQKWSHLAKGGGGFLGYCVDEPEAKAIIERFLQIVVPRFRGKRALHSFCLSNEPIFDRGAGCDNTRAMWELYLSRVHGSVEQMNKRYSTNYSSFADVPIPSNDAYTSPQFFDWCVFNQQRFADWHRWMADLIHRIAPEVPVHAKLMWIPVSWRHAVAWGIDPELFAEVSDINGNDCIIWPGGGDWGISWVEQNMFYDLQRSMAQKPIFNSENHLQPDGSTSYVPPEHYRCALWQGAVHGQGATTIWVWERTRDPGDPAYASTVPFYGNVMDRPGCALAVGTTCMDLNRFAEEVTALQNVRSPVAILYSMASYARNDGYLDALRRVYMALNFCGVKIDFISEKQIASGKARRYRVIILPATSHVLDTTFEALLHLPRDVRLIVLGNDCCAYDQFCRKRSDEQLRALLRKSLVVPADADARELLWAVFLNELARAQALPGVRVLDAKTGRPVWGVEWLPGVCADGKTIVNLVNLTASDVEVRIYVGGRAKQARDLLSLGGRETVRKLKPITPVLAVVE